MNTRSYTAGLPGCTSSSRWEEPATKELPMETVVGGLGTDWLPSVILCDAMTRSTQRWRGKHTNREDTWSKSLDAFANEIAGGGDMEKKTSLGGNADSRLKVRVAPPASANKQVAQRPMWQGGGSKA